MEITEKNWQELIEFRAKVITRSYNTQPVQKDRIEQVYKEILFLSVDKNIDKVIWCKSPFAAAKLLRKEGYSKLEIQNNILSGWYFYWAHYLQFCNYLTNKATKEEKEFLDLVCETIDGGVFWAFEKAIIACENPHTLKVDDEGRLHSLEGPALAWEDFEIFSVSGVDVPAKYIKDPLSLSLNDIKEESNAETKRAFMLIYGLPRFIRDTQAQLLDSTPHEQLYLLNDGRKVMICNDHSTNRIYNVEAPRNANTINEVQSALYGLPFANLLPRS